MKENVIPSLSVVLLAIGLAVLWLTGCTSPLGQVVAQEGVRALAIQRILDEPWKADLYLAAAEVMDGLAGEENVDYIIIRRKLITFVEEWDGFPAGYDVSRSVGIAERLIDAFEEEAVKTLANFAGKPMSPEMRLRIAGALMRTAMSFRGAVDDARRELEAREAP